MAALRANTMQSRIKKSKFQNPKLNNCVSLSWRRGDRGEVPKKKPTNANGIAKIVWLNLMSDK
jgi:hypothetical protein